MDSATIVMLLIIVFALAFSVTNGWNDAANAIATVVGTRVMSPWTAIVFGAVLNTAGAFFSSEVANTIGKEIADPNVVGQGAFLAAVVTAPIWITICTLKGLPISCSHSLLGAIVGAVIADAGPGAIKGEGVKKIFTGILTSPIAGFLLGFVILIAIAWLFRRMRYRLVSRVFGKLQILSAGAMAFAHGTGDAQKAMGLISGALVAGGFYSMGADGDLPIPWWNRALCAATMGLGSAVGGWAVMRTLGSRIIDLKPYQGFAAETAAAVTILSNTLVGIPISTTHSITGAIMGVGAAQGTKTVRWGIGKKIVYAWLFTFPACIIGGWLIATLFRGVGLK